MTSWRRSTSQQAQDDFDELLNVTMSVAEQQIGERGGFFPFGAVVSRDGAIGLNAAGGDNADGIDSFQALDPLYAGARGDADRNRAAAFLADVRVPGGDAIRFEVEHIEGRALEILIPYRRSRLRKSVRFAEMSVRASEPRIWSAARIDGDDPS